MKQISKSNFVSGTQCHKKLYFDKFRKDLIPETDSGLDAVLDLGTQVGVLARQRFPNGHDATPESYVDFTKSITDTSNWIQSNVKTVYEAAFARDGVFAALDILHNEKGKRWAIEVKSSTEVKDYHLTDASLQYWVMNKSGVKPDKFFIMHINSEYVRSGEIDVKRLFKLVDITGDIIANQNWIEEQLLGLKKMLQNKTEPNLDIGKQCSDPFSCQYQHHCWKHIPESNSVFHLYSARGKEWQFYQNGILHLKDIDDKVVKLNHRQKLQVNGAKKGEGYIDKVSIKNFLKDLVYPLYFFDFETIFPGIPVLDNTSPYEQVPFQFSIHIQEHSEGELIHREFLADPRHFDEGSALDPRKLLLEALKAYIGKKGSIIAYNATFEINVLKSLAESFPNDKKFIDQLISRFVDLWVPFRNAWYYSPAMGSSASIKAVLPALAPKFSYSDLEIGNGEVASNIFLSMILRKFEGDEKATRTALLSYCERDTLGMVILYKKLLEVTR